MVGGAMRVLACLVVGDEQVLLAALPEHVALGPLGSVARRAVPVDHDRRPPEGGQLRGEVLRMRAAMKPISTVPKALDTVDVATGEAARAINQRSDVCAVPAAGVVAEAMVALVLADATLEKFGGDSVAETARNARAYLDNLAVR